MADKLIAFYLHRRTDGSSDSICLTCFVTVAFGKSEAELVKFDRPSPLLVILTPDLTAA
jgi:hypothetical protein